MPSSCCSISSFFWSTCMSNFGEMLARSTVHKFSNLLIKFETIVLACWVLNCRLTQMHTIHIWRYLCFILMDVTYQVGQAKYLKRWHPLPYFPSADHEVYILRFISTVARLSLAFHDLVWLVGARFMTTAWNLTTCTAFLNIWFDAKFCLSRTTVENLIFVATFGLICHKNWGIHFVIQAQRKLATSQNEH